MDCTVATCSYMHCNVTFFFLAILSDEPGDITWAAILTWGMSDGLVRIINGKTKPAVNFIQHSPFEEVLFNSLAAR